MGPAKPHKWPHKTFLTDDLLLFWNKKLSSRAKQEPAPALGVHQAPWQALASLPHSPARPHSLSRKFKYDHVCAIQSAKRSKTWWLSQRPLPSPRKAPVRAKPHHVNGWINVKVRASPEFREMAMKKNLILAAVILLATLWFALDAGVEAMLLLNWARKHKSTWSWMLWPISWRVTDPVALRPTWKANLFWLLVVFVVVLAVAS